MDKYVNTLQQLKADSFALMERKNHDYRGGTGDPYANFRNSVKLGISPEVGILLRMCDKHQRLRTFISRGILKVKDEAARDSILDCHNYTVLCMGMLANATTFDALIGLREYHYSLAVVHPSYPECPMAMIDYIEGLMQAQLQTCPEMLAAYTWLAMLVEKIQDKDLEHG